MTVGGATACPIGLMFHLETLWPDILFGLLAEAVH